MTGSTTQKLTTKTLDRCKKYGQMGDSFDDVLNKILDLLEKRK